MIKIFLANIPFFISAPFHFIAKANNTICLKLVLIGGKLHMKLKTPLGLKLIAAEKELTKLQKDLKNAKVKAKDLPKRTVESDATLAKIISNGGKNGPTFH